MSPYNSISWNKAVVFLTDTLYFIRTYCLVWSVDKVRTGHYMKMDQTDDKQLSMKHKHIRVWAGIMRERRTEKTESMKESKIERRKKERERERQMEKQRGQISRFLSGTLRFEIKPEADYLHAGFT